MSDQRNESSAASPRRIGVDACWCSEDDTEPKYGHADDHILGRTASAAQGRDDALHLLRSCLTWGGVRELVGADLHDRALVALDVLRGDEEAADVEKPRYKVVFTPVGWQVVDTQVARDPVADFGTGKDEYVLAVARAQELNRG